MGKFFGSCVAIDTVSIDVKISKSLTFILCFRPLYSDTSSVKDLPYIKTQKVPPGFSDNVTIFSKQEEMDWQSVQTHYLSKKTDSTRGLVE